MYRRQTDNDKAARKQKERAFETGGSFIVFVFFCFAFFVFFSKIVK